MNLSPPELEVQNRVISQLQIHPSAYIDRYIQNYRNIFGSDNAAELFEEYSASPKSRALNRVAVARPAAWVSQNAFWQRIAQVDDSPVIFTAGGTASGKSTFVDSAEAQEQIIYDSTFSNLEDNRRMLQRVLDNGRRVAIIYLYQDPAKAWAFALKRAAGHGAGRMISPKTHAVTTREQKELSVHYVGKCPSIRTYASGL